MKLSFGTSFAILAIALSACDRIPPVGLPNTLPRPMPQPPAPRMDNNRLPTGEEVQRANALLQRGQRRDAAKAYFNAAQKYRSPDKERLILQAAELAALTSDRDLAQVYLSALGQRLNTSNLARYRYIQGQLAISDASYTEALRLLPKNVKGLPNGLQQKILNARLRAAQSSGDRLLLANELVIQESKFKQKHQVTLNRERIWSQLNLLSEAKLSEARGRSPHPIMRGWLDLNYLKRVSSNDSQQLNRNIKRWQRNFPRHPAMGRASKMIRHATATPYRVNKPAPSKPVPKPVKPVQSVVKPKPVMGRATPPLPTSVKQVVVILPLTGALGSVGKSLLSGIKKAQRDHAPEVKIKVYDSNSGNITALYSKAVSSGHVDFVIGPFSKVKIAQLSRVPNLPVNTLGLNYMGNIKAPTGLYQFGLLPEDETVQVAQRLLSQGHKKIAIVVPDSMWGRRIRDSFSSAYTGGGGRAVITINYTNNNAAYTDISKALAKRVGNIDAIFLAASPSQAKAIKPLLHNSVLKSVPVYATSHIFSGLINQYKNVGLEGIIYTEIPWIIEVNKKGLPQNSKYPRLRALGMDALMVAKGMPNIKGGSALNGRTGRIQVKSDGTLHRELKWAKFNGGLPILLP
ncbi:MAG: penicillin-binding protein activator [Cocleimonas sp.]|nr:penicillin-binding protein activator [Cocleimonas sp.]